MRDIDEVRETICDDYCKYRDEALSKYKDPDEAQEWLEVNSCDDCPFNKI